MEAEKEPESAPVYRRRGRRHRMDALSAARLADEYFAADTGVRELAARWGICPRTVYQALRRYGHIGPPVPRERR